MDHTSAIDDKSLRDTLLEKIRKCVLDSTALPTKQRNSWSSLPVTTAVSNFCFLGNFF